MPEPHPVRILLLCAGGFSSSLLMAAIMKAADAAGLIVELHADTVIGVEYRDFTKEPFDIILLAPQVRFCRKTITRRTEPFGIIVQGLDPMSFGMADGEKLLRQIQAALETSAAATSAFPSPFTSAMTTHHAA